MLGKMDGIWAPKPSAGPHSTRECLPLVIIIRNRLKYALSRGEAMQICMQKEVKIDGKVRTDINYPAGFMGKYVNINQGRSGTTALAVALLLHISDYYPVFSCTDVVQIPKTSDQFRLLLNTKGRFVLHRLVNDDEANYKLCRVKKIQISQKKIPFLVTNDGRTIRYPDPVIKVNDTVKVDLNLGKITDHIKFEVGNLCMISHGRNTGRVGIVQHIEHHPGSFDIVEVKDSAGHTFATRLANIFIIGKGARPSVTLPRGKGIKLSILEEKAAREKKAAQS